MLWMSRNGRKAMPDKVTRNRPVSGMQLPRYSGISTFMRLPYVPAERADDVEIALLGLPWDGGTTTRTGARYGPRQIREMSTLLRSVHPTSGINPYALVNCADVGDAPTNPVDPVRTMSMLEEFVAALIAKGAVPLSFGGDHLVSLPVLRALKPAMPLALVHFDAHSDMYDYYYEDAKFTHGTPFRRAVEEGLVDPRRTIQIGIRGTYFATNEHQWCMDQGIQQVGIDELRDRGCDALVQRIRDTVGTAPAYLTFDIDCLDPSFAPGTGVPEIAGVSTYEAQRILRGLRGLDFVGGDFVELSPPIDPTGNSALVAANLGFEILCLLAESIVARRAAR
jgi:guanidinopropionase